MKENLKRKVKKKKNQKNKSEENIIKPISKKVVSKYNSIVIR